MDAQPDWNETTHHEPPALIASPSHSQSLLKDLRRWGDRTSSLMTAYPGFEDFLSDEDSGRIRFARVRGRRGRDRAWVGATEPLTDFSRRVELIRNFFAKAQSCGARAFCMPVSRALASALCRDPISHKKYHSICVGAEPVFELQSSRFDTGLDEILRKFPRARALKRRGCAVREISLSQADESLRRELQQIEQEWKAGLRSEPMGFLNQVDPWVLAHTPEKRCFVLTAFEGRGHRIEAFLTALKVPARNAWYFAEVLRRADTPHGATPLLMFESMMLLRSEGSQEVRLGMAPLAYSEVDPHSRAALKQSFTGRILAWISDRDTWFYGFRSNHEFKRRLKPSRWDPLFLVSSGPLGFGTFADVARVHFPNLTLAQVLDPAIQKRFSAWVLPRVSPRVLQVCSRTLGKWPVITVSTGILLLALHGLRLHSQVVAELFRLNFYSAGSFSWSGWLWGPLFHNHAYHLTGDVVSFLFFGAILEWLAGRALFLVVLTFGFWATNPLAAVCIEQLFGNHPSLFHDAAIWSRFLAEKDYGSSNAVYAFVGALAMFAPRRLSLWLWVPFVLNGLYLCWVKESWLSLHHLIGLAGGAIAAGMWLRFRNILDEKSGRIR